MRHSRIIAAALALTCACAIAQPADPSAVLADLSRMLADARKDPAKAKNVRCPANTRALVGLPLGRVMIELGQPDAPQSANAMTYVIGSTTGAAARGELTFRFDASGAVRSVDCRNAR